MDNLCDRISAIDKRVGFIMVATPQGEIVETKMPGKELMPRDEIARFAGVWASIVRGIVLEMEKYFGKSNSVTLSYMKLNIHGFAFDDKIVVVSASKDLPLDKILSIKEIAAKA